MSLGQRLLKAVATIAGVALGIGDDEVAVVKGAHGDIPEHHIVGPVAMPHIIHPNLLGLYRLEAFHIWNIIPGMER